MTQGYVLEVRIGVAEPASVALVPGTPLDPTSFGRTAMWRLSAEGVLDVHGYVYFDGHAVYVQSADPRLPIVVNRHRIGTAWTELRAPATIHVGQAQIDLKISDSLARSGALVAVGSGELPVMDTRRASAPAAPPPAPIVPSGPWDGSSVSSPEDLAPPPAPSAPPGFPATSMGPGTPGAPFARGAFVPQADGESTRFAPMVDPRAAPTSPVIPVPIPLSAAAPAPKPAESGLWGKIKADWYATSMPKRILFVLSPLVVLSYFNLLYGDDDTKEGKPRGAASASASASVRDAGPPALTSPPPWVGVVGPGAVDSGRVAVPPQSPRLPGEILPADAGRVVVGQKTLERAATDALAEGNLPLALQLYERLVREQPENPAFRETLRILRERQDAGR